ncbi:hypothetical protein FDT66_03575 [Polaribacter aestuariivivens]|uniref:Tetratricopeptide repeat protein n=1 Tax=Polaribacter aestuariivivens TaxID=2304626 RepID=A0A5S3N6V0_9FLAO|nr:hypothetical protein [Polaribacter aestuariivivens]TMM31061.1 hypothetical protein FDT66_03575 [Polaribacter aestuariivivens]
MKKIILILCFTAVFSCNTKEKKTIKITDVEQIGLEIEHSLANYDIIETNKFYDVKAFTNRFLIKTSKKNVLDFNTGFYASFSSQFNFGELIVKELSNGSSYDFIRAYQDENKDFHLLFRLFGDGLNYHDHLVKIINGQPKIVDSYIYLTGENLSETFGQLYKSVLYSSDFFSKYVKTSDVEILKDMNTLKEIKQLNASGQFVRANEAYQSISNKSKRTKIFKLIHLMTVSNLSEDVYQEVILDYENSFPNDPSLFLVSVDGYLLKEQYEKSLESVNKLDEALNGDPFLDYLRGNIYYFQKEYAKALEKFQIINKEYPDFIDVYDGLLSVYIATNENEKAVSILNTLENKFQIKKEDLKLSLEEGFINFTKTKEFKNWYQTI